MRNPPFSHRPNELQSSPRLPSPCGRGRAPMRSGGRGEGAFVHFLFMPCQWNVGRRPVIDSRFAPSPRAASYRRAANARPTPNQRLLHVENLSLANPNYRPQSTLRSRIGDRSTVSAGLLLLILILKIYSRRQRVCRSRCDFDHKERARVRASRLVSVFPADPVSAEEMIDELRQATRPKIVATD